MARLDVAVMRHRLAVWLRRLALVLDPDYEPEVWAAVAVNAQCIPSADFFLDGTGAVYAFESNGTGWR